MKDYFERANEFVSVSEGGDNFTIVNGKPVLKNSAKADVGGATRMGITWGTLKAACKQGLVSHNDITKMTKAEADIIYKKNYWEKSHADEMEWPLCLMVYDAAVNHGVGGAAKLLQRACNKMGSALKVDGAIGPLTMKEVIGYFPQELSRHFLAERVLFYGEIVAKNPSQKVFMTGWLNRVRRLEKEVG